VAMNRIEVITSVERRRRWSAADKARLIAAMNEPGAVTSEIARDAGVDTSLLYRWRRQLAGEIGTPAFVPLRVTPDAGDAAPVSVSVCEPPAASVPASITITIGSQVRITVEGSPDAATLTRVIGALTGRDRQR
jgi:transposase